MSSYAEIAASAHIGLKAYLRQKVDEFIEHFRNTDEVIRLEIADYTGALPQLRIWKKWSTAADGLMAVTGGRSPTEAASGVVLRLCKGFARPAGCETLCLTLCATRDKGAGK